MDLLLAPEEEREWGKLGTVLFCICSLTGKLLARSRGLPGSWRCIYWLTPALTLWDQEVLIDYRYYKLDWNSSLLTPNQLLFLAMLGSSHPPHFTSYVCFLPCLDPQVSGFAWFKSPYTWVPNVSACARFVHAVSVLSNAPPATPQTTQAWIYHKPSWAALPLEFLQAHAYPTILAAQPYVWDLWFLHCFWLHALTCTFGLGLRFHN